MASVELRQRLLGALVLICLGVIVWSLLFTGPVNPSVDTRTQIPPLPELEPAPPTLPERPAAVPPVQRPLIDERAQPVADVQPQPAPVEADAALDSEGLPVAWALQVASLSSAQNAETLRQRLQEGGYKVWSEKADSAEGQLTRVLVGPVLNRERAEELKQRIDESFQVDALVYRFVP